MTDPADPIRPIGLFDSGVGGLSVLRAIRPLLPERPLVYFADQGHVPYGSRSLEEVRGFSESITRFLLEQGAQIVVVACNAASAAALHSLRRDFPGFPFVGMEPAVKPAAETTRTGVVGVLATPATFQGELYASVVERFGGNVELLQDPCPGLVAQIEAGGLHSAETRRILEKALRPMLEKGIDTVVLGCTHYPFVIPLIEEIAGPGVRVIDPAPAVARQTARLLEAAETDQRGVGPRKGHAASGRGSLRFFTSGPAAQFEALLPRLLGQECAGEVQQASWTGGRLTLD